jgi:hypothetical protein
MSATMPATLRGLKDEGDERTNSWSTAREGDEPPFVAFGSRAAIGFLYQGLGLGACVVPLRKTTRRNQASKVVRSSEAADNSGGRGAVMSVTAPALRDPELSARLTYNGRRLAYNDWYGSN